MLLIVLTAGIVLMAGVSHQGSAKCDIQKEFKAEIAAMQKWGKEECDKRPDGFTDDEAKQIVACYNEFVHPHMTSDNTKTIDEIVTAKVFTHAEFKNMCKSKPFQDHSKDSIMKKPGPGISGLMKCKSELEAKECKDLKTLFDGLKGCLDKIR